MVSRITDAVATLLIASSIAGLIYGPRGWWYDADPATLPAFLGQDAVTLALAVPLLIVSAVRARRGSLAAAFCWMGTLFYVAYSYYFYVIGGRVNLFFPLYIAVVSLGAYGALAVLFAIDLETLPERFERPPRRAVAAFFLVTAVGFAALWLSLLHTSYAEGSGLPLVARAVIAVDGVILLPLLFYAGLALARGEPLGYALAGLLLVKSSATFLTLLVTTTVAWRWGQPVNVTETAAYAAGGTGAGLLLVWYLRSIRPERRAVAAREA